MKLLLLSIVLVPFLLVACTVADDCPDGINHLPMYGKVKKCAEQIESDSTFLKSCDENFKNDRKKASKYYTKRGWQYLYQNKLDTAMFRFNQAWMLDSLNSDVYWGFANLTGMQKKYKESLPLFNRTLKLNPSNSKIWSDASISYGQLFFQTQNKNYLDTAIQFLKTSVKLDQQNPSTYAQLTAAYAYFMQKDSAKKYLKIADQLDKNAVNPQVRKLIDGN
jgi:tetratricopeptide (TPR) repeat protein